MDTLQTKKDDFVIGDIQVKTMPGSTSGNPPSMKIPDSPSTPTPVVAVSQPAPRPLSPMMPGQASVNSSLGQKISQQNNSPIFPKKSNKKTTSFILMILLVVILGAGGYWYYAYGQTMLFARQMVLKLDVPYENYKSDFDFILDARLKKDPVIGNLGSNPTEMFMPSMDSVKVSLTGLQHNVGKNFDGNVQISLGAGSAFNFNNSIDYRQLDKDFYFKFNKDFTTDLLSGLLGMNIDLSEFFNKDRWLTYNWDDLNKLSSSDVGLMVNPDNFNLEKKLEERKKMDDYFKLFKLHNIFKIVDTKESKDTGNGQLKKLQLIVKPSKINDLINMLAILDGAYLNNTELKTTQDIKAKVEKDMAKDRADDPKQFEAIDSLIQNADIFVWVNTETKSIQGASVIFDGDVINLGEEKIILTGHYNFLNEIEDNYSITKPEQTITVQQAYENTMKKIMEEKALTMKQYEEQNNKETDADSDGLSDDNEKLLGTDPKKADTDGDGHNDFTEYYNGYNILGKGKSTIGAWSACVSLDNFDSCNAYCASIKKQCVDTKAITSRGYAGFGTEAWSDLETCQAGGLAGGQLKCEQNDSDRGTRWKCFCK